MLKLKMSSSFYTCHIPLSGVSVGWVEGSSQTQQRGQTGRLESCPHSVLAGR